MNFGNEYGCDRRDARLRDGGRAPGLCRGRRDAGLEPVRGLETRDAARGPARRAASAPDDAAPVAVVGRRRLFRPCPADPCRHRRNRDRGDAVARRAARTSAHQHQQRFRHPPAGAGAAGFHGTLSGDRDRSHDHRSHRRHQRRSGRRDHPRRTRCRRRRALVQDCRFRARGMRVTRLSRPIRRTADARRACRPHVHQSSPARSRAGGRSARRMESSMSN